MVYVCYDEDMNNSHTAQVKDKLVTFTHLGNKMLPKFEQVTSVAAIPFTNDGKLVAVNLRHRGLDLLAVFADVIRLDKDLIEDVRAPYDTVYMRSHFSEPTLTPEYFRSEMTTLVHTLKTMNPNVRFIDGMDTVDAIMAYEDKWLQYLTYGAFMPHTEQYNDTVDMTKFKHPVFKNRLSSRGSGVTWNQAKANPSNGEWIIQESLNIQEELRIYVILGEVYPLAAVRCSMDAGQKAEAIDFRELTDEEIRYTQEVMRQSSSLEVVGIDAARTVEGDLKVIEVNRSPGFATFEQLTGVNLARVLYDKLG